MSSVPFWRKKTKSRPKAWKVKWVKKTAETSEDIAESTESLYDQALKGLVIDVSSFIETTKANYAKVLNDSISDFSKKVDSFIENLESLDV